MTPRELDTEAPGAPSPGESPGAEAVLEFVDRLPELAGRLKREVARVIVGQDAVVDEVLVTLFSGGHVLLEGVPGLAKTLLVNSIASALSLESGRIQFTPDLMPSDVTGALVVEEDPATGHRRFQFREGPIFVNMLLADEINRSPPKTQAALLEGMAEGKVTAAGARHDLPSPFFVLATQNPIEQEGTYALPEAQLDRFLMKVLVDYPEFDEEAEIARRTTGSDSRAPRPALSRREVHAVQQIVRKLPASRHVVEYATRLVRRSRPEESTTSPWVRRLVSWGAGPRATQALILAAKAQTLLEGRFAVTRADVRYVAPPVLRHRILPSFQAEAEGLSADHIVNRLLFETSAFPTDQKYDATTRKILRF